MLKSLLLRFTFLDKNSLKILKYFVDFNLKTFTERRREMFN